MGLAETLRLRAARLGRTAEVSCGALGTVTVEALPLREIELLHRGADSARAIFYAACRELQAAGEALHRTGDIYTPDGILQFVSRREAEAAAQAVLALSGTQPDTQELTAPEAENPADAGDSVPLNEESSSPAAVSTSLSAEETAPFEPVSSTDAATFSQRGSAFPAMPFDGETIRHGGSGTAEAASLLRAAFPEALPVQNRGEAPDADAAARRLLEGLRLAKQARGG